MSDTWWVIRFTGIDGRIHELPNKFSDRTNADMWAVDMPTWQAPQIVQMWDHTRAATETREDAMGRTIKNALTEAEMLELFTQAHGDENVMDRYGADLLGRAIGHEMRAERAQGFPETMFYSNLIHELPHTMTRKVMAFTAAREVMAA